MTKESLKNNSYKDLLDNKFFIKSGSIGFSKDVLFRVSNTDKNNHKQTLLHFNDFGEALSNAMDFYNNNTSENMVVNFEFKAIWLNNQSWVRFDSVDLELLRLYAEEGMDDNTLEFIKHKFLTANEYDGESLDKYNFRVSQTNINTLKQECIHFINFQDAWAKYYNIKESNPNDVHIIHLEKKVNWLGKTSWILPNNDDIDVIDDIAYNYAKSMGMED